MDLNTYQNLAAETTFRTLVYGPLPYPVIGLMGEVGEFTNKVKKIWRDRNGFIDDDLRENLSQELGDILWYVSEIASLLGLSLGLIATNNISKLHDRKKRKQLQGEGDSR